MKGWESTKFKLYATISIPGAGPQDSAEILDFDVIQYSHEYELNSIPTCTLSLALGRRADRAYDPASVSMVHRAINVIKVQVPVVVYCKARTLSSSPGARAAWPMANGKDPAQFVVFRGNASGGAFSRAFGGVRYMLSVTHWLADMAYSSALSQQTHPSTPNAFFFPASFNLVDPFGGGYLPGGSPEWVGPAVAAKYFLPNTLTSDFWGGPTPGINGNTGLKQWFVALSGQDRLNTTQINVGLSSLRQTTCTFDTAAKNTDALRALARFEPFVYERGQAPRYKLGVPLPIDPHGADTAIMAKNIGDEVGLEMLEGYTNTTLWDKLAGQFHANYLFSVVPTVETALVVPFIPGLRGPAHRNIMADEYDSCDVYDNLPRALRAVAVLMGRTAAAGSFIDHPQQPQFEGIGGWFGVCSPGLVLFKQAPRWLTWVAPGFYSRFSSPIGPAPIATAISPGPQGAQPPPIPPPATVFKDAQETWDAYAQALYVYEVLKHRQGTLAGRVRFDIAPGSLVRIQAAEDKFTWSLINNNDFMHAYAVVLRVSTSIDAESERAGTTFTLAHVRTEAENADAGTSICRHPLWNVIWSGCSLVDDEAFSPVATTVIEPALVQLACGHIPRLPPLF